MPETEEQAAARRATARLGMWTFLANEVMFFGPLFAIYAVYRTLYPAAFAAGSRELDRLLGSLNTGVLLTSSFTMALAGDAARRGGRLRTAAWLALTAGLGAIFLGIKAMEWTDKFKSHHVPGADFMFAAPESRAAQLFFSLYFTMTGLHALHVLIGVGLMGTLALLAMGNGRMGEDSPVHLSGLYWHFVDIVWLFLFPLLYLIK